MKNNDVIGLLIEDVSEEKIDELEDKIFEITSWEEVEEILRR